MVLATSKTATSGMFPVLSYTTMTGRNMSTMLASFRVTGRHLLHVSQKLALDGHPYTKAPIHRRNCPTGQPDLNERRS